MTPLQAQAMIIAVAVRNAMEDFHCEHVPNELMPELNRAVRAGVMEAPTLLDLSGLRRPDACPGRTGRARLPAAARLLGAARAAGRSRRRAAPLRLPVAARRSRRQGGSCRSGGRPSRVAARSGTRAPRARLVAQDGGGTDDADKV